ncbi:arylsulfatase [Enterocloster citroniae]|uniref:arylsulfatase n=1 Tax=Enterocloster citroniae TaxID=358743 RepID=UPI001D07317E|nr:arylsulfatase [Enterocloster citroniae]MCB7067856.1 arylsulfatase [Enterocloster citroniae]
MERPNIVLITVDQMRRDCMGISGHPVVETPNLDMMKKNGYQFTRAYSAVPSCIPARAALMTGTSQRTHKRVGYEDGVPWNYPCTLASEFARGGYHTQCIGKMHVYPERNLCGFHNVVLHDGYLEFDRDQGLPQTESHQQHDDYLLWLKRRKGVDADLMDSGLECNSWMARPFPYEEQYHPTNWCISESIDFLRRRDTTKPFFLYTSLVRPHSPLDPPGYYMDLYMRQDLPEPVEGDWADKEDPDNEALNINAKKGLLSKHTLKRAQAAYYGHITHIDQQLRRLIQAVSEYGLLEDTVFVFLSDHGDMLGDHHLFRKALPYEGSAGIPLLVYDPGDLLGGKRNRAVDCLTEIRDVMPTLLDIAGLPIPASVEGASLLPVMRGKRSQVRDHLHGEHAYGVDSSHYIVTDRDKYIWYSQTGREQYFDLRSDPRELFDLIGNTERQERIRYLRQCLIRELSQRQEGYSDGQRLQVGKTPVNTLERV